MKELLTQLHTNGALGSPHGSAGKVSACSVGDMGSIPGLGRCPGGGMATHCSIPAWENSMDCTVHGVAESDTTERLSLFSKKRKHSLMLPVQSSDQRT